MLPTNKKSKCNKRKRRSHHALRPPHYELCPKCQTAKLSHYACDNCGFVREGLTLQLGKES